MSDVEPSGRLIGITLDCQDPERTARFWRSLLGGDLSVPLPGWCRLAGRGEGMPALTFQPVSESKLTKSPVHVDLQTDDIERSIADVLALGGQSLDERHDYDEGTVRVMADPDGHEFCLVRYF